MLYKLSRHAISVIGGSNYPVGRSRVPVDQLVCSSSKQVTDTERAKNCRSGSKRLAQRVAHLPLASPSSRYNTDLPTTGGLSASPRNARVSAWLRAGCCAGQTRAPPGDRRGQHLAELFAL